MKGESKVLFLITGSIVCAAIIVIGHGFSGDWFPVSGKYASKFEQVMIPIAGAALFAVPLGSIIVVSIIVAFRRR